ELYSHEGRDTILQSNTDYTVTVKANGETLEYTFNRPAYVDSRVTDIDINNDRFTIVNEKTGSTSTIKVPKGAKFDYQAALGERVVVWHNDENELVDYNITSQSATYDAIEIDKVDKIKLLTADV